MRTETRFSDYPFPSHGSDEHMKARQELEEKIKDAHQKAFAKPAPPPAGCLVAVWTVLPILGILASYGAACAVDTLYLVVNHGH